MMGEVWTPEPFELRIEVREVAPLEERIVRKVDPRHDVLRAEGHLLGLGEEIVDTAIEHEAPDTPNGDLLLWDQLGGIEHIKGKLLREFFIEELQAEFPFRVVAHLDGIPQIAAVEIRIGAIDLHRFVPHHRLQPQLRFPMKLDEGRLPLGIDEAEGMHAEAFHEAEGARDCPVRHDPHHHMHAFRRQGDKVPEVVMRRLRLRKSPIRFLLHRMDQVRKLDGVLNEEHRDIVPHDVPVAFLRVELHRKAADVARQVRRAFVAGHGREAHEGRGLLSRRAERGRPW